ncbi:MAG: xanthine dehydrogenase small subunit [Rhodoferax sp.]|nr:xanthine dehydrogenase small subunit [Rhodoferax sp.]
MSIQPLPTPLRFIRRGECVTLHDIPPDRTLLEVLREDLHCTGTKEGCGEGDCGACTVVVGEPSGNSLQYRAINSCIRLAHSIDGMALWTVEDLADAKQNPHPVQQAMVHCHGSQCGFCTPGFVMSLFALYQQHQKSQQPVHRTDAMQALSGNLCRCTGYRPILDAAQTMMQWSAVAEDEADLLSKMKLLAHTRSALQPDSSYISPRTLSEFLAARARYPEAQLVAGCTDVGLWVTKQHKQFARVLDITRVAELRRIEDYPRHIAIGAAAPLTEAFAALVADRSQLHSFAHRFAGLPVRNSGTMGGNVANGSPIGDSMPLLIALGAHIVLMRMVKGKIQHRDMPLEALYTGYRTNVMANDEVLAWIKVPKASPDEFSRVYKVSKRFEDDISAVCLAIALQVKAGKVVKASIGVGGVAATPVRARKTEAALLGQSWTEAAVHQAAKVLQSEFSPISDMRASAAYRTDVLGGLVQRFWLESQGQTQVSLEQLSGADA